MVMMRALLGAEARSIVLAALLASGAAQAAAVARVDRADIELNESFTLEIVVDTDTSIEPDLSSLEQDFYVGQGSQLSNTTIINGEISRSRTWTFVLMPKRAGTLTIPAISVGNEQTSALSIDVKEPSYAPPGEADVFISADVDFTETYVQAQVLYTIKIYRAVATRQPALRDPEITGAEVLVELAGDDRSYEAIIDGRAYNVVERVLALYPQESGEIEISPARFEARILKNGRITGRRVFESKAQRIAVLPIPEPPAEFPNASWLPARDLELDEDWSRTPERLTAGEPVTRHITVSALGQLETQIPAIELPNVDGVNIYPDKPDLSRRIEPGGIRGVRSDQYAMIGVTPGSVELPEVTVPWWDISAGAWKFARLPDRSIEILPSAETSRDPVVTAPAIPTAGSANALPPTPTGSGWRRASEILFLAWVATLFAWWYSLRPRREPRAPAQVPVHRQQARCLKAARKRALENDRAGARTALLDWASLQWPDAPPRNIGSLAARVSSPLADELRKLSRLSYGPAETPWDGKALAKALRSFAVTTTDERRHGDILPPLMPSR